MIGFVLITALFLSRGETPLLALIKENPTGQIYLFTCVVFFSNQGLSVCSPWTLCRSGLQLKGRPAAAFHLPRAGLKVFTPTPCWSSANLNHENLKLYLRGGLMLFAFQGSLDETLGQLQHYMTFGEPETVTVITPQEFGDQSLAFCDWSQHFMLKLLLTFSCWQRYRVHFQFPHIFWGNFPRFFSGPNLQTYSMNEIPRGKCRIYVINKVTSNQRITFQEGLFTTQKLLYS